MMSSQSNTKGSEHGPFLRPLWFAFFALLLLWLCVITVSSGSIGWSVHSLLLLAIAIGLIGLERETGLVSNASRFFRKLLQSRSLIWLGRMTRDFFVNVQRVPINVDLSVAYLVGLFGTAFFLLLTMTN